MMKLLLMFFFSFSTIAQSNFPKDFIFGVANAPAQVEDLLPDIWLDWANEGKVRTWKHEIAPEKKLNFWSSPQTEINLAADLGVSAFRMGIDWGRVMPEKNHFDEGAINRYREILKNIRAKKIKVMLTLWHHSVPKWVQKQGGWHAPETRLDFLKFSKRMIKEFHQDVDWWLTFNEANVWVTMAYSVGIWPPGEKSGPLSLFALGPFRGSSIKALDEMASAHVEIFDWAHKEFPKIQIGLAHNMAHYSGKSLIDRIKASFVDKIMNWRFPEKVRGKMDFFGFNYYGAEWLKGAQVDLDPDEEYSEAGRAIDVNGLLDLLKEIHRRFPELPIFITENGVADASDTIRPSYLIEHLIAVSEALKSGISVKGYIVWSLTDNLEWSDGYCPKFGLVGVNRLTMERIARPSYKIFSEIISTGQISEKMRTEAWNRVQASQGKERPFCRDSDGITAFDVPKVRRFSKKDWRFK